MQCKCRCHLRNQSASKLEPAGYSNRLLWIVWQPQEEQAARGWEAQLSRLQGEQARCQTDLARCQAERAAERSQSASQAAALEAALGAEAAGRERVEAEAGALQEALQQATEQLERLQVRGGGVVACLRLLRRLFCVGRVLRPLAGLP